MKKSKLTLKIVVVLLVICIFIFLTDFFIFKENHQYISGYICNITTEFLGIIVTLYFVQNLFDAYESKKVKNDEVQKILRYHSIISRCINEYILFFRAVVMPIDSRSFEHNFPEGFTLSDMRDLHRPNMLARRAIQRSSIEMFYQYEKQLRALFIRMLDNIDFNFHSEIQETIISFINTSITMDVSDSMISNQHTVMDDGTRLFEFAERMLGENNIEELYQQYQNNELESNIIMPYFILFDSLNLERDIIATYLEQIENLS